MEELTELARDLIRAPSPNPPGDERAAAAVVRSYLEAVPGAEVEVVATEPTRPNVIARAGPRDVPGLLLSAHLDTVVPGDQWTADPFGAQISDSRLFGLGSTDIKGAVAAMAVAFSILAKYASSTPITLVANADEEGGGATGMEFLAPRLRDSVVAAVVAEPSGVERPFEYLWVGARGAYRFTVDVAGVQGHTSLVSDAAGNAIADLVKFAGVLPEHLSLLRARDVDLDIGLTLNPVFVQGGQGWNINPNCASMSFDLRIPPSLTRAEVVSAVEDAVSAVAEELGLDVTVKPRDGDGWVSPSRLSDRSPLLPLAKDAWRVVLDRQPRLGCFPGGTDARSLVAVGIDTLPALGPGALARAHKPDEYVDLDELVCAAEMYTYIGQTFDPQSSRHR
jgi:acetylornithine deacetylase/succinyl-diaminopimelate desuccinylase-like protein